MARHAIEITGQGTELQIQVSNPKQKVVNFGVLSVGQRIKKSVAIVNKSLATTDFKIVCPQMEAEAAAVAEAAAAAAAPATNANIDHANRAGSAVKPKKMLADSLSVFPAAGQSSKLKPGACVCVCVCVCVRACD